MCSKLISSLFSKMITIILLSFLFTSLCPIANIKCSTTTRKHNHLATFSLDKTWPYSATVNSLHLRGSAVAMDWNNNLVILHRGSFTNPNKDNRSVLIAEDVIMVVSSTSGKSLATWGSNKFARPHGVEIAGKDLFITDVKQHQVFKFPHDSVTGLWKRDPMIVLGEKFVSGNDHNHLCGPTDVAVLSSTGDIYVADGYCNSRIIHFNKDGLYKKEFGAGTANPSLSPGLEFNVTHSITTAEPLSKNLNKSQLPPLIFVADRNNGRIQSFLENGTFLYEISHQSFGKTMEMLLSVTFSPAKYVYSIEEPYGTLYAVIGHLPVGESKVFEILVGKTGYHFRRSFPFSDDPITDDLIHNVNRSKGYTRRIETPHDIAVSKDGNVLYVVEAYRNLVVKKFVKFQKTYSDAKSVQELGFDCNVITILLQLVLIISYMM